MTKAAVIFDLDGVIVSTDDCHYKAWKRLADEEGIYFDKEINHRLRGVSRMESLAIVLERANRPYTMEEQQALADRKNAYYRELIQELTPEHILPGVRPLLERLKQHGIKIAIGSSSKNSPLILERLGLADEFDAVVDGNAIKNSKPHPEVFLRAAEKLGVPAAQCVVVEDADAGVEAALAAGMRVIGVGTAASNERATWTVASLADLSWEDLAKFLAAV
ncbi:beta-phosphoglucomutase [Capillibacterium thermochitinicola]|uniref:Beta-phosphoglucomutase n=1 Tax=Capillibacterium thermochitinicola TaxID=2699427 RepID=A0A8J6I2P7_9FIRM|nr:beta-phosphoglucomutase [Capillibacterium thermochitinicola]